MANYEQFCKRLLARGILTEHMLGVYFIAGRLTMKQYHEFIAELRKNQNLSSLTHGDGGW